MAGIAVHVHNTTGPFKVKVILILSDSLRSTLSEITRSDRESFSQISAATKFVKIDSSGMKIYIFSNETNFDYIILQFSQ